MGWVPAGLSPEWDAKAWARLQEVVGQCLCGGPEEIARDDCPLAPWMLMEHASEELAVFKHRISRACIRVAVALCFAMGTAALGADEVRQGGSASPPEPGPADLMAEGMPRYPYPSLGELEAKLLNNYEVRMKKLEVEEARLKSSLLNRIRLSASTGLSARDTLLPADTGGAISGGLHAGLSLTASIPLAELLPRGSPSSLEAERREVEFSKMVQDKLKELRTLYNEREVAILSTQATEADVRLAELRHEKARVAFSIQEADQVDVASAQKGLIETRLRAVEAGNKVRVIESRIAGLLGEPYEFPALGR